MRHFIFISVGIVFFTQFLTGCVQQSTTPSYVQTGGLVQVGLGGIKRNAQSNTINASDLSATITDSSGATYPINVSNTYRVFPDNTSKYIIERLNPDSDIAALTLPYDGGWYATLQIVDKNTGSKPPLASGPASIAISSAKLVNLQASTGAGYSEGNLDNILVTILPGEASPSAGEAQQFLYYEPGKHLTITPANIDSVNSIGGAQIKIIYNNTTFGGAIPPQVAPASHDPNVHVTSRYEDNGDGTSSITVFITNPRGFYPLENWSVGKSSFADLGLTVTPYSGLRAATWAANISIDTANSFYIDIDGNPIASVTPVLAPGKL